VNITRLAEGCQSPRVAPRRFACQVALIGRCRTTLAKGNFGSYALARQRHGRAAERPCRPGICKPLVAAARNDSTSSCLGLPAGAGRCPPWLSTRSMRSSLAGSCNGYGLDVVVDIAAGGTTSQVIVHKRASARSAPSLCLAPNSVTGNGSEKKRACDTSASSASSPRMSPKRLRSTRRDRRQLPVPASFCNGYAPDASCLPRRSAVL
jgi:hypothetical protein